MHLSGTSSSGTCHPTHSELSRSCVSGPKMHFPVNLILAFITLFCTFGQIQGWGSFQFGPTSTTPTQSVIAGGQSCPPPTDYRTKEDYYHHSSCCCTAHFTRLGKRCFDLNQCNNGNGGSSGFGFGFSWTFGGGGNGWQEFDKEQEKMCACMEGNTLNGRRVGNICCKNDRIAPKTLNDPSRRKETVVVPPHWEPPAMQTKSAFEKEEQPATGINKDDNTIHALEWTPTIKSAVQLHRNLRLLPELPNCGGASARARSAPYIIGGTKTKLGQHPWMVLIGIGCKYPDGTEEFEYKCGGSLINSRYVLTAAHCVVQPSRSVCKVTKLRIGEYDKSTDPDCGKIDCAPPVQDIDVEDIVVHKEYNSNGRHEHDIALLRLARPAELGRFVTPICLPMYDFVKMDDAGERLTVAGWGHTVYERRDSPDVLQEVRIPIVGRAKCQKYFQEEFGKINDGRFCAGGDKGRDSCHGDSGGPIMGRIAVDSDRKWRVNPMIQLGIVSLGLEHSSCSTAGPGHLTLYTKVSHYLPWILDNIKN